LDFCPRGSRTDTGHFAIQAEVARFTQGIGYDVLVVADEADEFGDQLSYRTYAPRLVAGTQGLVPSAWARPHEQWGATQLQERFLRQAGRWMTDRDYTAWMAVRAIGEAATRSKSTDPGAISAFLRSDQFELAAYKGARLSFRPWDGQLRQPILLADARSLVSVSPPPGRFLHTSSPSSTPSASTGPRQNAEWADLSSRRRRGGRTALRPPDSPRQTPSMSRTRRTTQSPSSTAQVSPQ